MRLQSNSALACKYDILTSLQHISAPLHPILNISYSDGLAVSTGGICPTKVLVWLWQLFFWEYSKDQIFQSFFLAAF